MVRYLIALLEIGWLEFHRAIFRFTQEILSLYIFLKITTYMIPTQILIMIEKVAGVEPRPQSRLHHLPSAGCWWAGWGGAEWDVEALILIEIKIYRSCSPGGLLSDLCLREHWPRFTRCGKVMISDQCSGTLGRETFQRYQICTSAHPFDDSSRWFRRRHQHLVWV